MYLRPHAHWSGNLGTFLNLLAQHAQVRGSAPAILAPGRHPLTYDALTSQVERTRTKLASMGLGRESRLALVLPDGPEMAVASLAVAASAVCAPLNPNNDLDSYRRVLKSLRADAVLVLEGAESAATRSANELGLQIVRLTCSGRDSPIGFSLASDAPRSAASGRLPGGDDVAALMQTSGTTSAPKIVPFTQGQLLHRCLQMPIDSSDRCLCVAPLFTGSAFGMNLLAPLIVGASVVVASGASVELCVECLDEFKPTYFSASPTVLAAILETLRLRRLTAPSSLRFVRSTSIALPASLQTQLEDALGVPVIAAYSMTETGRISENPLPPGCRRADSVGFPVTQVAIMSDAGRHLPPGEIGEILVKGPGVMNGYESNSEANGPAFHDGWFKTGDLGYFDDDGYLFLSGRIKETINRGGEKVAPAEVDALLLRHPAVLDAATFPVPHPTLGEDVVAAVVLRQPVTVTDQQLRQFIAHTLARHKVPSRIVIVTDMPKNALGKVTRSELTRLLADSPKPNTRVETRDQIELHLVKLWEGLLKVSPIGVEENFFSLGGDSLLAAQLVDAVERNFGRRLPLDVLWFGSPTIAYMASLLHQDEQSRNWPILVPIKGSGNKVPLFCVHSQGGNLFHYYELAQTLDDEQPVFGLQARGVYGGARPRHVIEEIATDCISAMREKQPCGPFRIVGYSSGGIIALDMARQLEANGEQIGLLALIDVGVPGTRGLRRWLRQLRQAGFRLGQERAYHWLLHAIRRPDLRRLQSIGEAQRWAYWSYKPSSYPGCALLLVANDSVRDAAGDDSLGWRRFIGGLSVHRFEGDHASLMKAPAVRELAAALQQCLDADKPVDA